MSTINDVLAASSTPVSQNTSSTSPPTSSQLGQATFLKLLTTQLQNQNPLQPTSNDTLIQQEAMFSQVEQLTKLVGLTQQLVDHQVADHQNGTNTAPPSTGSISASSIPSVGITNLVT